MSLRAWSIGVMIGIVAGAPAVSFASDQFARVGVYGALWTRIPVDARGDAMGLAAVVNPVGATAFWWNPAPLPEGNGFDVSYTFWEYLEPSIRWRPAAIRLSRNNLTAGFLWGRLSSRPVPVRTAYDWNGLGETWSFANNLYQFGLSCDLVPWLTDERSRWNWTLGGKVLWVREELGEFRTSASDVELASSVAWAPIETEAGRLRLHSTAIVRNLTQATFGSGELSPRLPRHYHLGIGFDLEVGERWRTRRLVEASVAWVWLWDLDDTLPNGDSHHVGGEVTVGGLVSVRAGYRSDWVWTCDGWSWGAGVQHRIDSWQGLRAAVDYGSFRLSSPYQHKTLNHWTVSLGLDLPY
jgi:hypothetical protein